MTFRSDENYMCTKCELHYLSYKEGINCPDCNEPPEKTSNIVDQFMGILKSYHILKGRITEFSGVPGPLLMMSTGDTYLRIGTEVLCRYPKGTPPDEIDIAKFVDRSMDEICGGGEDYMIRHYKGFMLTVFERFGEMGGIDFRQSGKKESQLPDLSDKLFGE